jgi:hypothetical protein
LTITVSHQAWGSPKTNVLHEILAQVSLKNSFQGITFPEGGTSAVGHFGDFAKGLSW